MSESNKYARVIVGLDGKPTMIDVYRILVAYGVTCPARQHAIKKLLLAGHRGTKSELTDLLEARQSVTSAIEIAATRSNATVTELPTYVYIEPQPGQIQVKETIPEPEPSESILGSGLCGCKVCREDRDRQTKESGTGIKYVDDITSRVMYDPRQTTQPDKRE